MRDCVSERLGQAFADTARVRVLCIGDVILDTYHHGEVRRISSESPSPIIEAGKDIAVPGGAGNVACNITDLGGSCVLIGLMGEDPEGALLSSRLKDVGGVDAFLFSDHTRPTSHKVRYCVRGQQILRFDRESTMFAGPDIERQILAAVTSNIADCSVLVLSDYAKGTLTDRVLSESIKIAKKHCIPVIVDPKSKDLSRYFGATLVTPNLKEAEAALGTDLTNDFELFSGARTLLTTAGIESILITRGPEGMTLLEDFESKALHVRPTFPK